MSAFVELRSTNPEWAEGFTVTIVFWTFVSKLLNLCKIRLLIALAECEFSRARSVSPKRDNDCSTCTCRRLSSEPRELITESEKLTVFSPDSATATAGSRTNIAAQLESERGCAEGKAGLSTSPHSELGKAYLLSTKPCVKGARTLRADSAPSVSLC